MENVGITEGRAPPTEGTTAVEPALDAGTKAVVILPTLNEVLGLERTLGQLPFERFRDPEYPVQPLVIDGGSTDGTVDVARRWNVPVLRQTTRGKGAAVLEAIAWAGARGARHVVVLDADATYPTQAILPALNLLREGTDLVVGVRQPIGGHPRTLRDVVHRIGNISLSFLGSIVSRRPILDICSGFWAVSTDRFRELGLGATEFAIEAELVLKAVHANFKFAQIPVEYRERLGQAKIHAVRDGSAILLTILRLGGRPRSPSLSANSLGALARQLLAIGLIAQPRTAMLEYPPGARQLANRLGLLLHDGMPAAKVRLRPFEDSPGPAPGGDAATDRRIVLSLSGASTPEEPGQLTVAIDPRTKELTVRLLPALPTDLGISGGWSLHEGSRDLIGRTAREYLRGFEAVTSRVDFDPSRQQRRMLRANGFQPAAMVEQLSPPVGGAP
jgi:hypothetical protein